MPVDKKTGKPFFIHPMLGRIEGFKNQKDFDKAVKTYNKKQGVKSSPSKILCPSLPILIPAHQGDSQTYSSKGK